MEYNYVLGLARSRRSIRRYRRDPVDIRDIVYAITVALEAPSGANYQPWKFIIIDDEDTKEFIRRTCEYWERKFHDSDSLPKWFKKWLRQRDITWKKPFLTDAPILIVVSAYKKAPYARESTWLAIGYLILALEERGLASLTYTPSNPKAVAELLNIPEDYSLETIIPVGKSAEEKAKEPRMSLRDATYYNKWGQILPENMLHGVKI